MSDEDGIKQAIQQSFVDPIGKFRKQASKLDSNHATCMQDFCNAVWSLIDGDGGRFSGPASNTFAKLMGQYIDVDRYFGDYDKGLSKKLGIAADYCDQAVKNIQHYLDTFPYADGSHRQQGQVVTAPQPVGQNPGTTTTTIGEPQPGGGEFTLGLLAIVYFFKTTQQMTYLENMDSELRHWSQQMWDLATAMEHETALPPVPKSQNFVADSGSLLDPPLPVDLTGAQRLNADIAKNDLNASGISYIDAEVDRLASFGLTPEQIVAAIMARGGLSRMQVRFKLSRLSDLAKMGYNADEITTIVSRVDEQSVHFIENSERRIANWLVLSGKATKITPLSRSRTNRGGDADVDLNINGTVQKVTMEFKSLDRKSDVDTLKSRLAGSLDKGGQAPYMVFDVSKTTITREQAVDFIKDVAQRNKGDINHGLLKYILIIGNGYSVEAQY